MPQRLRTVRPPRLTRPGATSSSPLFDRDWYLRTYPDVAAQKLDPYRHYATVGYALGYDPSPDFDTDWYLDRYPDAAGSGLHPLAHFLASSPSEQRDPNPLFSSAWYRATYPDVANANLNPLVHFLAHGRAENRRMSNLDRWLRDEVPVPTPEALSRGVSVTIVIPIHGGWIYTERCLRALAGTEAAHIARVLIVDDQSPDDSVERLRRYPRVEVLRLEKNLGYTRAVNQGVAAVQTPFVLLLNNDTEPQPGFLNAMLDQMERDPDVGLVGSRLVYPDGSLQEAGGIIWEDASGANYGRNEQADNHAYTYRRDADYCSAASILVRTESWRRVGGFDERYSPAYYEDTDLAFAIRDAGQRVVYEPSSIVVHHEGKSHGTDTSSGLKRQQVINQGVFRDKWRSRLVDHARRDEFPWAVCSHRDRPRIAFVVTEAVITPRKDSGSVRMNEIMKLWQNMGIRTAVFSPYADPNSDDSTDLRRSGIELITRPGDAVAFLKRNRDWVSTVWFSHMSSMWKWHRHLKRFYNGTPLVFDTVDLHHLRESAQAELEDNQLGRLRAETSRLQEYWAMERCDATVVVSETEVDYLKKEAPEAHVYHISNIHHPRLTSPGFLDRCGLLFVGSFQHAPNLDGLTWFLEEVWSRLPDHVRADGIDIVGGPKPEVLDKRGFEGIRLHGFVPRTGPYLDRARLSIAPLRYGGGVKGKVGEAWAAGLPVIGTSIALDGMVDSLDYPMSDTAEAFAEAIGTYYLDQQLWEGLRVTGLSAIEQRFAPAVAGRELASLQQDLDNRRRIPGHWRPRAEGRIRPWDLPGWSGAKMPDEG